MKNILISIALAPYRLDFYNYLHQYYNCEIFFLQDNFTGQLFDTNKIKKECIFTPHILNTGILDIKILKKRKYIKNLKQIIESNQPDTIFVPEFSLTTIQVIFYKFFHKKKFKIVSICDDSYNILIGNGFSKLHHYARKLLMPFIDEIILVDNKVVDWYTRNYKKGIWVPIIRDEKILLQRFDKLQNKALEIRSRYSGRKILLFVGRLINVKNIPILFQAYQQLQTKYELFIIGDGILKDELEQLSKSLTINVHFLGKKEGDELYLWYKIADIFILPSYREAFGAVTNEALLAGCKCVISKHAGSSCLIKEGINGYTFNPYSAEELVECIKRTNALLSTDRTSQMPITFSECMDNMINKLNQL